MSAIDPRPQRADARRNRERIVEAAKRLLAVRGSEVQIDDIAREAGVGTGTMYRHFPTKDALIGELLVRKFAEKLEHAERALAVEDPWEAFEGFLRGSAEAMERDAAEQGMWSTVTPEAVAVAIEERHAVLVAIREIVRRAHEAGVLDEAFMAEDVPTIMCSIGANMQAHTVDGPLDAPVHDWRRLLGYVLAGVRR